MTFPKYNPRGNTPLTEKELAENIKHLLARRKAYKQGGKKISKSLKYVERLGKGYKTDRACPKCKGRLIRRKLSGNLWCEHCRKIFYGEDKKYGKFREGKAR